VTVRHSIELFSGLGGLALGMSRAGWKHELLIEWDRDAVSTVEHNRKKDIKHVRSWPIVRQDVREADWNPYRGKVAAMSGGPPCQPFAIGGKKRGHEDDRDMWPETARAVRVVDPHAFVFENVRNLAGPKFKSYLEWVKECLRRPHHPRSDDETHEEHLARLRAMKSAPFYLVDHVVVNAADYGASQIRYRVLVRGVRASAGVPLAPMAATHSRDRLLWNQWVSGEYWTNHGLPQPPDSAIPKGDQARVRLLRTKPLAPPTGEAWITVRDAIAGLGEPDGKRNHVFQAGAKAYKGHTGSALDMPSKALKAGDHGVPGGENMMILPDGKVRYFTVREAARLVNLPDEYLFNASWTETMRGLGNAVPAALGKAVGLWLMATVEAVEASAAPRRRRRAS
jgi:DNA (cytosine-5)-methyltransferase 1